MSEDQPTEEAPPFDPGVLLAEALPQSVTRADFVTLLMEINRLQVRITAAVLAVAHEKHDRKREAADELLEATKHFNEYIGEMFLLWDCAVGNDGAHKNNVGELFGSAEKTAEALERLLRNQRDGGNGGGVSDDWKESVDRRLAQLHGDVRALLNRGVAAIVALALAGAGACIYFNEKFEKVADRITAVERKTDVIEERLHSMDDKLNQIVAQTAPAKVAKP